MDVVWGELRSSSEVISPRQEMFCYTHTHIRVGENDPVYGGTANMKAIDDMGALLKN